MFAQVVKFAAKFWCRFFRFGVKSSARQRGCGHVRTSLWERARNGLSDIYDCTGQRFCAVRNGAKTEAYGNREGLASTQGRLGETLTVALSVSGTGVGSGTERFVGILCARRSQGLRSAPLRKNGSIRA